MTFRRRRLALVVLVSLSLCGCSAGAGNGEPSASDVGTIELGVSEACSEGSDPQCIEVGGEYVVRPSEFEDAAVEDAAVSEGSQQNAVLVTFTEEGASIVNTLTNQAAQAGSEARLIFKIEGEMRAAVMVMEPLDGDQVTIALAPEESAQELVELLTNT